jgi:hypothetical protein
MNSNANEKFNAVGDRPLGAAKPVDPATRLSELLAQSLEELTRPFDPPRIDPLMRAPAPPSPQPSAPPARPVSIPAPPPAAIPHDEAAMPVPTESRLDDKALAELEAELFAAASKSIAEPRQPAPPPPAPPPAPPAPRDLDIKEPDIKAPDIKTSEFKEPDFKDPDMLVPKEVAAPVAEAPVVDPFVARVEQAAPAEVAAPDLAPASAPKVDEPAAPAADADTTRLVSRVRRLMFVSMAITIIGVGSVFGFIGYRVFKGEGSVAKTADKVVPTTAPAAGNEMTLTLPRGARVVQSAVSEERLIITLDVGGRIEVRTFDLKTLQPAGRLTFSTTP